MRLFLALAGGMGLRLCYIREVGPQFRQVIEEVGYRATVLLLGHIRNPLR